jgi:hypothetical protein
MDEPQAIPERITAAEPTSEQLRRAMQTALAKTKAIAVRVDTTVQQLMPPKPAAAGKSVFASSPPPHPDDPASEDRSDAPTSTTAASVAAEPEPA